MRAAWYRARADLRSRRSVIVLVLLIGLSGGAVLTTLAGARRSSTAFDRFRQATLSADLDVAVDGEPTDVSARLDEIAALPQVVASTRLEYPFIVPAGSGMYPYLDFLAVVARDRAFGTTIDRMRLLDGRAPRPDRAHEVAVLELFARQAGIAVGDRVEFESYTRDQLEPLFAGGDAGPPAGPRIRLTVTGVVDAPDFISESVGSFQPLAVLSPAFRARHAEDVASYPGGIRVRLRRGDADVTAVGAAARRIFAGQEGVELAPASEVNAKIESGIDVGVVALLLCAAAAALASTVAVAQAFGRHFGRDAAQRTALAALGMPRRQRVASLVAGAAPIVLAGAGVAALVASVASPLMPVGLARRAEPDPGFDVDLAVVLGGAATFAIAIAALAGVIASLTERRTAAPRSARPPSRAVRALRSTNLPPTTSIGIGRALDPGIGTGAAVRAALVGAVTGVAAVVAAVVFAASLAALADEPGRYGAPWDARVSGFTGDVDDIGAGLLDDRRVERITVLASDLGVMGGQELSVHAVEARKGPPMFTVLRGRLPGPGEVVLGSSTLRELDAAIGDTVELQGTARTMRATVVGRAPFPIVDERSAVDRGALVAPADFARISAGEQANRDLAVSWVDGVDVAAAREALGRATGAEVAAPIRPSDVNNLVQVDDLPRALAAFLAALALLAAIHALVATVRRRRNELAVLRTLGFGRSQLGATVAWQATTIAAVGTVFGVPSGIVVGRQVWRLVARSLGVVEGPIVPATATVAVAVAALVIANVIAAAPARSARRVGPASVLRAG